MKCAGCGHNLNENAKFCPKCGTKVTTICKKCGYSLVYGTNFCTRCGTAVNEATPTEKKKKKNVGLTIVVILIFVLIFAGISLVVVEEVYGLEQLISDINGKDTEVKRENYSKEDENASYTDEDDNDLEDTDKNESENVTQEEVEENEIKYDVTEGGIHRYDFYIDDCTWTEAFVKAIQSGGYLVRINSLEEYDYILSEIERLGHEDIQFRIGARRDDSGNNYYWVDTNNNLYGEIINSNEYWASSIWMQGEPSFVDGEIKENCLDIYYYKKEAKWVMNDIPDDIIEVVPYYSGKVGYIVEYEE